MKQQQQNSIYLGVDLYRWTNIYKVTKEMPVLKHANIPLQSYVQ